MTPTPEQVAQWAREAGFSAEFGTTTKDGKYTPLVNALGSSVPVEWVYSIAIRAYTECRSAKVGLPDHVLAPVYPTEEQIKAGDKVAWPYPCTPIYQAMLTTAPQPRDTL